MGIEPTHELVTRALVLKTRRPTRRLGTSDYSDILTQKGLVCKKLTFARRRLFPIHEEVPPGRIGTLFREMRLARRVHNYTPEEAKTG